VKDAVGLTHCHSSMEWKWSCVIAMVC